MRKLGWHHQTYITGLLVQKAFSAALLVEGIAISKQG